MFYALVNRCEKSLSRDVAAVSLSVLLHSLPVVLGLIPALALRLLPKPPIEFELLPAKPRPRSIEKELPSSPPPSASVEKPVPPSAKVPGAAKARERPKPNPKVERFDLSRTRLAGLGPLAIDQALGLRVVLRMAALQKSPHRPTIEALLDAFPDTHILAAGTAFADKVALPGSDANRTPGPMARALVADLEALLIETADPRDISATVFYAVPRPGSTILEKLAERRSPRWDLRSLHTLRPNLLAFARPELLGPSSTPLAPPGAPPNPPDFAVSVDPQWIDRLISVLKQPGPAVYAEIVNVQKRIRLRSGLPTPVALRLALSAEAAPEVHARIELFTESEAQTLIAMLPDLQRETASRLFWLGLGGLLSELRFQGSGSAVEITGHLPRGDTAVLLAFVRQFLPPPDRFLDPPPVPNLDLGTPSDGGTADAR